ncbi:hypothetical protein LJR257_006751 [Ensifer adhaerens]
MRGVDFGLGLASSKDDPKAARDNIANIGRSLAKAGVAAHEDRIMYRLKQRAAAIGQPSGSSGDARPSRRWLGLPRSSRRTEIARLGVEPP